MKEPVLPDDVIYIINEIKKHGYEAYIVGGCVRDTIMGRRPNDWDITTSAVPEEVKKIFRHTVDTGIKHGTVTAVIGGRNYEITTYRIEGGYEDCRRPSSVSFTRDLHKDLLRRDFTSNAVAYSPEEGYVDIFGGMADIERKIIRGVGDPCERFREDALRMLRVVRFSVQLDFEIESNTYNAIRENGALIKNISAERVREELTKTLLGDYLDRLPVLWETGLIRHVSPPVYEGVYKNGGEIIGFIKKADKNIAEAFALFLDFVELDEALKFVKWLKFDGKTFNAIKKLLENRRADIRPFYADVRKAASNLGAEETRMLIDTARAKGNAKAAEAGKILEEVIGNKEPLYIKDLKITGNDIMAMGVPKGREVGGMLNFLLDKVLDDPRLNTFETLSVLTAEELKKERF